MLKTRTTTAAVGTSTAPDTTRAAVEATERAVSGLGGTSCDFLIVFGGMGYDQRRLLDGVHSVTQNVPLVGCSAQGVVSQGWANENPRVVGVMAIASEDLSFSHSMVVGLSEDSYAVGRQLSEALLASPPAEPVVLLCMYDPLTGVNVDQLLRGLESVRPLPILGGAASHSWGPIVETYQYSDRDVAQDAAACVLISGKARAEFGVSHGAVPLGMEMTITKARGNVVFEIDGRPAYRVWRELVGAGDSFMIEDVALWAIGIRLPEGVRGEYEGCVTRTLFKIDPDKGSIYLQSEIPEGTRVVFHHRTFEAVTQRALRMAERLKETIGERRPHFVLSFECGGRSGPFLGRQGALDEICRVQEKIGGETPWLGMYAWGELAPLGNVNFFHNYTFPICALLPDE